MRLLAEKLLHDLDDLGHARHAADEDHLVDVGGLQARVLEREAARPDRLLDEIVHERFELRARELDHQVLRARSVGRDERQVHLGLHRVGKLDLRLFRRFLEALARELVLAQVDALLLLELFREVVDHARIEILAAQERVAVRRDHVDLRFAVHIRDFEHGDVERAAAEIVNGDLHLGLSAVLLVDAIGERRRGGLVDDAQHVETGDLAGVFRRLALAVVEIGGNGDDGLRDRLAEIGLGGFLHLLEDERADLRGGVFLAAGLGPSVAVVGLDDLERRMLRGLLHLGVLEAAADEALDGVERGLGIGDGLALGGLAHEALAVFQERDLGGRGVGAFAVEDDLGLAALHDRDARAGRAEIDADDFGHDVPLLPADPSGPVALAPRGSPTS